MKRRVLLGLLFMLLVGVGFINDAFAAENVIKPRVIIGTDDRELVSGEQLEQAPYRWTVFLDITFEDGSKTYGSGAMISKDTVLTCGHVLFDSSKGWASNVKVHAGYDGVNNKYYAEASEVLGLPSWTQITSFNSTYDLAAIKLDRNLGEQTGWFSLQQTTALREAVTLTGYPGEKNKTMWTGKGTISTIYSCGIAYNADTTGGNSGSPVYNMNNELVAIHAGGVNSSSNGGSKITDTAKKMIDFWVTGQAGVEVTGVSLSQQLLSLEKDQVHQLSAVITPSNASIKGGKWTSSDSSVATVDYNGKVTGKNQGQATITFTTDDNKKQASCLVNVVDDNYVPLERIEFSYGDQIENVERGRSFATTAPRFIPTNASNKEVYYSSSNTDILDMELKDPYLPKYRQAGLVDIYCHSKDNGQAYKVKTVRVDDHGDEPTTATPIESGISQLGYFYEYYDVDYFEFTPTTSEEYVIDAEVLGVNSTALNQAWESTIHDENGSQLYSSNKQNFSYSFKAGKTYFITPKLRRFFHLDEEIYRTNYVLNIFPKDSEKPKNITGITLPEPQLELDEGATETLLAEITPADTTDDKTIEWSSSDEAVATVANGEVTGVSEGTATITARTSNGLTAVCEVTVNKVIIPVERIELSARYKDVCIAMPVMNGERISAKVYPENAADQTVEWTSSDPTIIAIDEKGRVMAFNEGVVTITATIGDISSEASLRAISCVEEIKIDRIFEPNEVYEKEIKMPSGEIGKGFNTIVSTYRSDNGFFYSGDAWITIVDSLRSEPILDKRLVEYGGVSNYCTELIPNSTLSFKVANKNQYRKSEVKVDFKVYSRQFWTP